MRGCRRGPALAVLMISRVLTTCADEDMSSIFGPLALPKHATRAALAVPVV
jgi:hypothetical protein